MRRLVLVVVVDVVALGGCSFSKSDGVSRDAPPGDRDGPGLDAPDVTTPDAPDLDAPPGPTCLEKWAAGTVALGQATKLAAISSSSTDRDPFVTADGLELFFFSDRAGSQGSDVYVATRAAPNGAFANPQRRADISSSGDDGKTSMTGNQLIAVVSSNRPGSQGGSFDLYMAKRPDKNAQFGAFDRLLTSALNDNTSQFDPTLSADGLRLYYAFGSPQRIVMASRQTVNDPFGATLTDIISTPAGNADPAFTPDEKVIIFSSTRAATKQGVNLWYATRATTSDPFGDPIELAGANTNSADGDPTLSPDGCQLFFASDRDGTHDLFVVDVL
ncbi:MAG: PD40 domain-containing protein [Deltaproteobacteria bacterium]|nr:PD40 domain-containing protein [Deltaproteobacteria bacterium]